MSQDARRARRAGKIVLQLYREHAPHVADAATRMGVTCKAGCSHCCKLPATATVPEIVPVVEALVARADWTKRRPALERELTRHLEAFATVNILDEEERAGFFTRQLPCVFLKNQRCEIYAHRPAVCRYHMVISIRRTARLVPPIRPSRASTCGRSRPISRSAAPKRWVSYSAARLPSRSCSPPTCSGCASRSIAP